MVSFKKSNKGFTIVELLIVIVVIGILALLVITTYSGIQSRARNAKRSSDIKSLQTQIEAFFSQNGYYPSLTDLNTGTDATTAASSSWATTNMPSLDQNALVDPSNPHQTKNLLSAPDASKKQYAYSVFQSDGTTSCESDHTQCAKYTLTANYEGSFNGSTTATAQNLD